MGTKHTGEGCVFVWIIIVHTQFLSIYIINVISVQVHFTMHHTQPISGFKYLQMVRWIGRLGGFSRQVVNWI